MEESKSISRAPGYYQWILVTFIIIIIIIIIIVIVIIIIIITIIIIIIIIILFVHLSIFIANEFLLTTVNKNFKSFKILLTCRISPPEVLSQKAMFCGCAGDFRGRICTWV